MQLFNKADEKLKSRNNRRRQKTLKSIKDLIDPKIEHNLKNVNIDNRILHTVGEFESNKFCKLLQHEREILEKYRRKAVRVEKVNGMPQ